MKIVPIKKLPKDDRKIIAEKMMEIGNIIGGSLLFNQFMQEKFSFHVAILGLCGFFLAYFLGILYLKGE